MVALTLFVGLFLVVSPGLSFPEQDIPYVEPEYLDMLLETNQYELFSKLMKIENSDLVREKEGERSSHPMLNEGLKFGDILPNMQRTEEDRQGIRFERYGGSKWQNGVVYYAISSAYNSRQRAIITRSIETWNEEVECIKFVPRTNQRDYVLFFSGDGCYANLGRVGGQQPISLQRNGCMYESTVIHEMDHTIGFAHEQNRWDRDDYIEMLWENIPEEWQSQYEKTDPRDFGLQGPHYDYLSIMHYPVDAPGTDKPAFRVKQSGVDERRIGNGERLTKIDLQRIKEQYC